jgi:hypothetical protein
LDLPAVLVKVAAESDGIAMDNGDLRESVFQMSGHQVVSFHDCQLSRFDSPLQQGMGHRSGAAAQFNHQPFAGSRHLPGNSMGEAGGTGAESPDGSWVGKERPGEENRRQGKDSVSCLGDHPGAESVTGSTGTMKVILAEIMYYVSHANSNRMSALISVR